jgi:hydroxypyruvate isomerase
MLGLNTRRGGASDNGLAALPDRVAEARAAIDEAITYAEAVEAAAVPDRGAPDHGELHDPTVFSAIKALGWTRPLGAEYRPGGATEASLGWMP